MIFPSSTFPLSISIDEHRRMSMLCTVWPSPWLPSLWIVPCGCETRWKRSWLCLQELLHFWGVSCCGISETSGISRQAPIRMKDSRLVCTLGIRVVLLTSCPSILANWQFNHPLIFRCVISCTVRIFPCRSTAPLHMHMHIKEGCGSDPHMLPYI